MLYLTSTCSDADRVEKRILTAEIRLEKRKNGKNPSKIGVYWPRGGSLFPVE